MDFDDLGKLEDHLKNTGVVLVVQEPDHIRRNRRRIRGSHDPSTGRYQLSSAYLAEGAEDRFLPVLSDIFVSKELLDKLNGEVVLEDCAILRLSTTQWKRGFVYLDISEFSKMSDSKQLLVVAALLRIAKIVQSEMGDEENLFEAQLCIGDGYIYVWKTAPSAARFAAKLARKIEEKIGRDGVPEFHFRMGVHVGLVRCFWDPGRKDWNYIGHGINGGNRVLSAIGKDTDDVVFVSGQLRSALVGCGTIAGNLLPHLHNRGRKKDKHDEPWRVYELHHSALTSI